ncbi:MAG: Uma2 family endonuclease [Candidatus Rokubacteria bacterium]|nr:Uma2 family endonuclease [Candidatus Rokubacteria bacterium]
MATGRIVLTYEDYAALPNDGRRYEVHDGELSVTPAPGRRHQEIIGNLYVVLRQHVEARALGVVFLSPFDVILSATTVVQPDLVYVESSRISIVTERGVEGPPSVVVEVISPSTGTIDRAVKFQLYARHRVPFYWIVDPDARSIEAYERADTGYVLATAVQGTDPVSLPPFPELRLNPASLWP